MHARYMLDFNRDGWEALEITDLVKKRAHLEGSMVKGYMVYQTMAYIHQYSDDIWKCIDVLDCIWDFNSMDDFEGEHLLGKGRMSKVRCK